MKQNLTIKTIKTYNKNFFSVSIISYFVLSGNTLKLFIYHVEEKHWQDKKLVKWVNCWQITIASLSKLQSL